MKGKSGWINIASQAGSQRVAKRITGRNKVDKAGGRAEGDDKNIESAQSEDVRGRDWKLRGCAGYFAIWRRGADEYVHVSFYGLSDIYSGSRASSVGIVTGLWVGKSGDRFLQRQKTSPEHSDRLWDLRDPSNFLFSGYRAIFLRRKLTGAWS